MFSYPSPENTRTDTEKASDPFSVLYPTGLVLDGIDLRRELEIIRNNRGHWIVFRKFDKSNKSEFWDEKTQSAVGGPMWEYTDTLVLVRKSVFGPAKTNELNMRPGELVIPAEMFYLPHTVVPAEEDIIIEITPSHGDRPVTYQIVQAKNIKRVDPMRDIQGRIEFYQVLVEEMAPRGDSTLI